MATATIRFNAGTRIVEAQIVRKGATVYVRPLRDCGAALTPLPRPRDSQWFGTGRKAQEWFLLNEIGFAARTGGAAQTVLG